MSLPLPPKWLGQPRSPRGAAVWVVAVTAFLALVLWGTDEPGRAIGLALSGYCTTPVFLPSRAAGVEARDGGLVLPQSRLRTRAPLAGVVALLLSFLTTDDVGPALVLVVSLAIVAVLVGQGRDGAIRLDPEGVRLSPRRRLPWSEARPVTRRIGGLRVGDARLHTDRYQADPVVLYWTLHYYATHPESRDELADGRALDRVLRARDEPGLLVDPPLAVAVP